MHNVSYHRLQEQRYQTERLTNQLTVNSLKRDALLENRKHAILMLDSLKNVGQENTAMYVFHKLKLNLFLYAYISVMCMEINMWLNFCNLQSKYNDCSEKLYIPKYFSEQLLRN